MSDEQKSQLLHLTADIVTAHVANNSVASTDVPAVIEAIYNTLSKLGNQAETVETPPEPAVPVRSSIKPDYIICLEDGKKLKMLKRHLMAHYNMTPAEYRAKWNLPASYPMVAPSYAEARRAIARASGLGRKPAAVAQAAAPAARAVKAEAAKKPAAAAPRATKAAPAGRRKAAPKA